MIKEIGSAQKPSSCSKNQDGIITVGKKVQELKISHSGRSTNQSDKRNWKKIPISIETQEIEVNQPTLRSKLMDLLQKGNQMNLALKRNQGTKKEDFGVRRDTTMDTPGSKEQRS